MGVRLAEGAGVAVGGIGVQGSPVQTADKHDKPITVCEVADVIVLCTGVVVVSTKPVTGADGRTRVDKRTRSCGESR